MSQRRSRGVTSSGGPTARSDKRAGDPSGEPVAGGVGGPGDRVSFPYRRGRVLGTIVAVHAKTATVAVTDLGRFRVPWSLVTPDGPANGDRRLRAVAERARVLLARHGLATWTFAFDGAKRRGGACHFARRRITMAAGFATTAAEAEVEDTLLHEIAHALVGRRHHHDAVWQAKAKAIGCTAQRCHSVTFSEHPLVARCVNGCFAIGRHRSRRNMRCRRCGGAVVYAPAEPA
jgi:predicted SprT family Zn-dependent metalloprotease